MAVVAFDTLKLADRLEAGGFSAVQARTAASAFADAMSDSDLATKADLSGAKTELKNDIAALKAELKSDIAGLRTEFKGDIAALKAELKSDIAGLRTEFKGDIAELRTELKGDIAELRVELKGDITGVKGELSVDIARVESKIAESKADTLKAVMGMIVGAVIVNVMVILGGMFGLAKLLGH